MGIEKNKRFFKGIRNAGNSRKSALAKQAINAICGDAPDKEAIPAKDTPAKYEIVNATCQCCEKTDVTVGQLVKIDSGQKICKDCLNEMRSC